MNRNIVETWAKLKRRAIQKQLPNNPEGVDQVMVSALTDRLADALVGNVSRECLERMMLDDIEQAKLDQLVGEPA